ncbi:MAG: substrate-binding domain-containing protein, partial [Eubacteriales bacterium]|nr:substrate-binding domain-containing protein [Eubacteriales bacterium]
CGIIYQTDAFSANLEIIDTADVSMCGKAVYPVALLDIAQHKKEANEFLEFLKSDKATKVFSEVGFTPLV